MKRPVLTQSERTEIARRYLNHEQTKDIARAVGCSAETVRRVLKADGVWTDEESPQHDTAKQIRACLNCKREECTNCIGWREEVRKRERAVLGEKR